MLLPTLIDVGLISIDIHQNQTTADVTTAPMNAPGLRSVWPRNAIPILGQFRLQWPSRQDETARRQDFPPPNCYRLMTAAIQENQPAPRAAATARPATARAARTARRRAPTARPDPASAAFCARSAFLISSQFALTSAADVAVTEPNTCGCRLISFAASVSATSSIVNPPSAAGRSDGDPGVEEHLEHARRRSPRAARACRRSRSSRPPRTPPRAGSATARHASAPGPTGRTAQRVHDRDQLKQLRARRRPTTARR